jgi:hypothetical protein
MSHLTPRNWADVLWTAINIRHDAPPTLAYGLFYGGIGVALVGFLGLLPRRTADPPLVRAVRVVAVIGRASFVSYVAQQWLIETLSLSAA